MRYPLRLDRGEQNPKGLCAKLNRRPLTFKNQRSNRRGSRVLQLAQANAPNWPFPAGHARFIAGVKVFCGGLENEAWRAGRRSPSHNGPVRPSAEGRLTILAGLLPALLRLSPPPLWGFERIPHS